MSRRILMLFPDEWDRAAAHDPRYRGRYEFLFEGFDLFSFPDNARLFTFDALRFVERLARKYSGRGIEAVVTSDEQFGSFLASIFGGQSIVSAVLAGKRTIHLDHARRLATRFGLPTGAFLEED